MSEGEIIEFLTISMTRITGTLVLSVYNYHSTRALVSRSALGIVLIILALILAHTGIQKKFSPDPLTVTLCMTVSALWSNSGIVHLLIDNKILSGSEQFHAAVFPGLLAISTAFFIIGCVGTLHKKGPLPLMAFALGLANVHVLALFDDVTLGPSGIACNFMIVTVISIYLVAMRFLSILKNKTAFQKEIRVNSRNRISRNHLIVAGIIANMVSSSVLCGKLIGTSNIFFIGQAHWMFTSAMYQVMVSVASFRACDIFHATFFSFLAVLKFAEGYSLLNQPHLSNMPLLPLPFMVVFAILFCSLGCIMSLHNLYFGLYILLFAVYCATLTLPSGISHDAPQAVNLVIFLASIIYVLTRLYMSKTDFKISQRNGLKEIIFSCLRNLSIKPPKIMCCSYSASFQFHDVDVIGHAFNTLAAFLITVETHASFILVMVTGSMVYVTGLFSLSAGKTFESSAFIFHGIWWIIWGLMKYATFCVSVNRFHIAIDIICFLILNIFFTGSLITLNKVWFIKSLTFEVLLINVLLQTLNILPGETTIAFSIFFGIVSFYCFLTTLLNGTVVMPHLPWGEPFLRHGLFQQGRMLCPLPAKKVASIKTIAEIMNAGGVCVIPADTGYVIASACHSPDTVQKVSQIHLESTEKEISIFINSLNQLQPLKYLFTREVWDFIEGLWPNPVGFVLPKIGDWLQRFGLTSVSSLLDSSKNVILYISDCEVTGQIMDRVGPIAVRSLTKGTQILSSQMFPKLLTQVDGILLDMAHDTEYEFTVVDCTKMEMGILDVLKVGSVPKIKVLDVLHRVITRKDDNTDILHSIHL